MTEFLNEIRKKDKNAVRLLYNHFGKKLFAYAVSKWKLNEDAAWDLIYITLYKVIEVSDRYIFEDEKKLAGFVFTIFTNNLRNHYNKEKKQSEVFNTTALNEKHEFLVSNLMEENPEGSESGDLKILREELQKLEDWKRILLLMRAQEFSYEEISKFVDKSVEQLKVYHMRLKKEITEKLTNRIKNGNA